jgi:hypothetical protein
MGLEHAKVQEATNQKIERITAEQFVNDFDTKNINSDDGVGCNDKPGTTSK